MSSNGDAASSSTSTPSAAIGVGFSSIGNNRHGESSSRAESRSSGRRSSEKRESPSPAQEEEADVTPPASVREYEQLKSSTGSVGRRTRKSGGFLLDSAFANGSPRGGADLRGKRATQDGQLRVDKRRPAPRRLSGASSMRSSPLSQEIPVDGPADGGDEQATSRAPSMDTTQLVQMALNLSESRKRNVSSSLRVPSGRERSISPALMSNLGTIRATSSARNRSSNTTDDTQGNTSSSGRTREQSLDVPGSSPGTDNVFYTFSPATLARAEKARKYFELASDHRRLLQSLPPLKPDSSAPLGRAYNPIQSLRNRRIRLREKRPFPAPPETWQDVEKVNGWIDNVESVTFVDFDPDSEDVHLPTFAGEDEASKGESRLQQNNTRHHRSDTIASVITRPENSWTIEPAELLADAYWTEHGDNKAFIEGRDGKPVFPDRERHSVTTPRISVELHRGRNESVEPNDFANDFDEHGKNSRRRKLILPLTAGERRKARRLIARPSSSSSGSSKERRATGHLLTSRSEENVGPLERHMQDLIERDAKGELSSPDMSSPDHWRSRNKPSRAARPSIGSSHRGSFSRPEGRASLEVPREIHRRSRSADGRVGSIDQPIVSADDNTSEPASPQVTRNIPSIGMDLTLPSETRRSFEGNRPRGPTLPSFRPQPKEKHKIAQTDFAEGSSTNLSPILSASYYQQKYPTPFEDSSPEEVKRQRTNDSWMGIRRLETGSTNVSSNKESVSTVGRFLRNRRGKIFGNKDKVDGGGVSDVSANVSDVSDMEDGPSTNEKLKRRLTDDMSPESARDSLDGDKLRPRFYINNLPSFTSSARDRREKIETPGLLKNDPIGGAVRRPEKFDRLVPPVINLPDGSRSDPDLAASPGNALSETRKSYGNLQPLFGELPRRSLLTGAPTPGISQSKRHWSIYDNKAPIERDAKIAPKDIARVRALLLASGIKAREILRRADDTRDPPSAFLAQATNTTGQHIEPVGLKEEPLVAAQLLGDHLSSSLSGYETTISKFQAGPARDLGSQLENLRQRATDHLSKLTHDTSDEADAFTIELNTRTPQQTRRVDDAVDEMLRRRRRQLRVLRVTGYKLLEWLVLAILWWIWFLVAMFNIGRKIVVAIWRIVHWLFSL